MYDPWVTREIRIRDLFSNRSGLGVESEILWYATDLDRDEIVRRPRYIKPESSFRSQFAYRNTIFLTAGQITPAVTGMSWDEFVKERIFKPLGMTRSNTSVRDLGGLNNVATPHLKIDDKVVPIAYRNIDNIGGAGAINASIKDMAQWLRFQLANGVHEGRRIADAAVIEETHKPHTPIPLTPEYRSKFPVGQRLDYCLSWITFDYQGDLCVFHTGTIDGFHAAIGFLSGKRVGAVILANYENQRMSDALLRRAPNDWDALHRDQLEEQEACIAKAKRDFEAAKVQGAAPTLPLDAYTGTYENDIYGKIKVTLEGNHLVLHFSRALVGDLRHWHFDTFQATWRDRVADVRRGKPIATFTIDAWGKVSEMNMDDLLRFKRLPPQ